MVHNRLVPIVNLFWRLLVSLGISLIPQGNCCYSELGGRSQAFDHDYCGNQSYKRITTGWREMTSGVLNDPNMSMKQGNSAQMLLQSSRNKTLIAIVKERKKAKKKKPLQNHHDGATNFIINLHNKCMNFHY